MNAERRQIAIVDDEEPVRVALRRLLRSAGFDAVAFASGAEILEYVRSHKPDCIVLDLHMPVVNGFEVQRELAIHASRIPVVIVTGHDTEESCARAWAGGASGYLLKPVNDQLLIDVISAAIESRKSED